MASLFRRLEAAESAARAELETLRTQARAVEARLSRLSDARETLLSLVEDESELDVDEELDVVPGGEVGSGPQVDLVREGVPAEDGRRRPLSGVNKQVVTLMASAQQPLRARDVAQALGEPDEHRRVETTRTRLKRLVSAGWLAEPERGIFTIAAGVNGFAAESAAEGDTDTSE